MYDNSQCEGVDHEGQQSVVKFGPSAEPVCGESQLVGSSEIH